MPARDGTGPLGQGARTGRSMGNCNPQQTAVQVNFPGRLYQTGWFGRMWNNTFGRAFRRGRRNRPNWR